MIEKNKNKIKTRKKLNRTIRAPVYFTQIPFGINKNFVLERDFPVWHK